MKTLSILVWMEGLNASKGMRSQGAKKVSFTVCHLGIAHKSFQLAPKPLLISRIDYNPSVI